MTAGRVIRLSLAAALLVGLFACGQEPDVVPVRNLERPSDMHFVCLSEEPNAPGGAVVTARPITACHPTPRDERREPPVDLESRTIGTFSLVTNTARGEVAVVDLNAGRLIDLDPISFGFNMLPVGKMPETIDVSTDGCQALTANRASCDFSLIDTSRLLAPRFSTPRSVTGPGSPVARVVPWTEQGRLAVTPGEAVFVPELVNDASLCASPADKDKAPRRRLIATFPACDLVALLELPAAIPEGGEAGRARILDSVRITPSGVEPLGPNPRCPSECGEAAGTPARAARTRRRPERRTPGPRAPGTGATPPLPRGRLRPAGASA
jgi:hypothetical protein